METEFVQATYERLDKGLRRALKGGAETLLHIVIELDKCADDDKARDLWVWATIYSTLFKDVSRSAMRLLVDGKHSRTVTMLRSVAFEYRTRFHYYWEHADKAKLALHDFNYEMALFASRLPDGEATIIYEPDFDPKRKRVRLLSFEAIAKDVYGAKQGDHFYAKFYSHPSFMLHGASAVSMDVLELRGGVERLIHLDSRRPFTNDVAGNLIVFILDFSIDVCRAFGLSTLTEVERIADDFQATRKRLRIEIEE